MVKSGQESRMEGGGRARMGLYVGLKAVFPLNEGHEILSVGNNLWNISTI